MGHPSCGRPVRLLARALHYDNLGNGLPGLLWVWLFHILDAAHLRFAHVREFHLSISLEPAFHLSHADWLGLSISSTLQPDLRLFAHASILRACPLLCKYADWATISPHPSDLNGWRREVHVTRTAEKDAPVVDTMDAPIRLAAFEKLR